MKEVTFKIEKEIGVVSKNESSGWQKEVNLVAWNDKPAKIDIRDWNPDHTKAGKGLVLSNEEAKTLGKILSKECK